MRLGDGPGDPLGYELIDAGDGRRLERFGAHLIDRPAPGATAPRRAADRWRAADLRFEAGSAWTGPAHPAAAWPVMVAGLTLELRTTSSGGVGLYPEHGANVSWLDAAIRQRIGPGTRPLVLNLFAHTGLATIAAACAGAAVAHVDAARSSVAWARRNAASNGLAEGEIRWLVDDATAFVEREGRRGRRYDGLVIDPPSSGRGRAGRWTLRDDLPRLLDACARIVPSNAFVLLTTHSTGVDGDGLAGMLEDRFGDGSPRPEVRRLDLIAQSGAKLDLGWAVRLGGASARNTAP